MLKRLRSVELKLDMLIEKHGLTEAVKQREQEQAEEFARRAAETAEQFRNARLP